MTTETTNTKKKRNNVSDETFITAWMTVMESETPSIQAVADLTGLKPDSVQQRATKMRNPPDKRLVVDKKVKAIKDSDGKNQYVSIPVEERALPIPLPKMPRGGGGKRARQSSVSALAFFQTLVANNGDEDNGADTTES